MAAGIVTVSRELSFMQEAPEQAAMCITGTATTTVVTMSRVHDIPSNQVAALTCGYNEAPETQQ